MIAKDKEYWNEQRFINGLIHDNNQKTKILDKEIEGFYQLLGNITPTSKKLKNKNFDEIIKKKYHFINNNRDNNIRDLVYIHEKLNNLENKLNEVSRVIQARNTIYHDIPCLWPLSGDEGYKTSGFGFRISPVTHTRQFHLGVDIAGYAGTSIISAANGIVIFSGEKTGYGKCIIIKHKYGYKTVYAHNKELLVKEGQKVLRGEKIALLGNTGFSTGNHLHFEVRVNDKAVDPWPFITTEI